MLYFPSIVIFQKVLETLSVLGSFELAERDEPVLEVALRGLLHDELLMSIEEFRAWFK